LLPNKQFCDFPSEADEFALIYDNGPKYPSGMLVDEWLFMLERVGGVKSIAMEDITDDHRMVALGILTYLNMIKQKVEQEEIARAAQGGDL